MKPLLAALATMSVTLVARAEDDGRLEALERSVQALDEQVDALTQAQERTEAALAAAQGTLDLAGQFEEARNERIGALDDLIERAAEADVAMMGGAVPAAELAQFEVALMQLHERARAESGRLESDQELAAAITARLAAEALAGGDLYAARGYLAGMATAAAGARDAAMGNAGRAWAP